MAKREKLTECEELIMSILWSSEEDLDLMTVTDNAKERFGKDWKLQTVATFMTRLEKKKYISVYRIGRYSHYHPVVSIDEYRKEKMEEVCGILFEEDLEQMARFIANMAAKLLQH